MAKQGLHLQGDRALQKALRKLGDKAARKVSRSAVSAAATPVAKAARRNAPKESGLLRKSIGRRVRTYTERGTVIALVGPRRNFSGEHEGERRVPANYAHLVENGHLAPDGSFVPPKPFLRPALDASKGEAMNKLRQKTAEGIEREAKKASKGGGR
ncbi:MAG: HK97-gp10 family putative phage morphogenesis protein [Planctomycetota bacterium]